MFRSQLERTAARCLAAVALAVASPAALGQFVEQDVATLYTLRSDQAGDGFGWVGAAVGDLNGDGASEIVIGALRNSDGGPQAGKAFVYSGRDGALLHTVQGSAFDRLGHAVAGVGDVDADGIADYAIGGPGGPGTAASLLGRVVVLSGRTHAVLIDRRGPQQFGFFGYDIDEAGDVNQDGHADVLVGAPFHFLGGSFSGAVHVISGKDGAPLAAYPGPVGSRFGTAVSRVGDQNFDGRDDFAVGAMTGGKLQTGEAYVISSIDGAPIRTLRARKTAMSFGNFFVHDAGDVNGDGCRDIYVGDFADSEAGPGSGLAYVFLNGLDERRLFRPDAPGGGFGPGRGAGDVNHDGHADLIVASYLSGAGAPGGGQLHVISGRNGKVLRTMTGNVQGAQLGFDVLPAGDVNGDHFTDFLVTGAGVAHLILGNRLPRR